MADKKDIIAQAQTGTGKTAVFGLPLIEKLDPRSRDVQAIILAPTRELVIQVTEEIDSLKGDSGITTAAIYGGQFIQVQLRKLRDGVSIVVGTPGRVQDHIRRGSLVLSNIRYFILDEADEMLNMGFIDDIEEILKGTPKEKRILLFSATMPKRIKKLAENYMGEYDHVRSEINITTDLTEQIYFEVSRRDKMEALSRILDIETDFYGIIFCKTKADVDELNTSLQEKGYKVDNLHGDISQPLREKILGKFRNKKINILVATDVAARGIDVEDLTHVINYSIPNNPEAYVHRIGRTGRAGKKGTAITFVTPAEFKKMDFIKRFTKADIRRKGVPNKNEMVGIKKKRVEEHLGKILETKESEGYRTWARQLMEGSSEEDLISALLKYSFGKDLEEGSDHFRREKNDFKKWKKGEERPPQPVEHEKRLDNRTKKSYEKVQRTEKLPLKQDDNTSQREIRLFIALGKKQKMNRFRIIEMIQERNDISEDRIGDIEIHGDFSFVTVPARDGKSILKSFRKSMMGKEPLVRKANEEWNKRGERKKASRRKGRN